MIFNQGDYSNPMDRNYHSPMHSTDQTPTGHRIEEPIGVREIGQSVTEGNRFGAFRQSVNAAIRAGARKVELQTQMGGGAEPVGAESYGKHGRN
jgi:hypothetical protein